MVYNFSGLKFLGLIINLIILQFLLLTAPRVIFYIKGFNETILLRMDAQNLIHPF